MHTLSAVLYTSASLISYNSSSGKTLGACCEPVMFAKPLIKSLLMSYHWCQDSEPGSVNTAFF